MGVAVLRSGEVERRPYVQVQDQFDIHRPDPCRLRRPARGHGRGRRLDQFGFLQRLWQRHRHGNMNSASNYSLRDANGNLTMVNGQFQPSNYSNASGSQFATAGVGGVGMRRRKALRTGHRHRQLAQRGRHRQPQHHDHRQPADQHRQSDRDGRREQVIERWTKGSPSHDTPRTQISPEAAGP